MRRWGGRPATPVPSPRRSWPSVSCGQPGIDLDADPAVGAAGALVRRRIRRRPSGTSYAVMARTASPTDTCGRRAAHLLDVVRRLAAERLVEDRRVGRDSHDMVLGDESCEAAGGESFTRQVVEPDGDPGSGQLSKSISHAPEGRRSRRRCLAHPFAPACGCRPEGALTRTAQSAPTRSADGVVWPPRARPRAAAGRCRCRDGRRPDRPGGAWSACPARHRSRRRPARDHRPGTGPADRAEPAGRRLGRDPQRHAGAAARAQRARRRPAGHRGRRPGRRRDRRRHRRRDGPRRRTPVAASAASCRRSARAARRSSSTGSPRSARSPGREQRPALGGVRTDDPRDAADRAGPGPGDHERRARGDRHAASPHRRDDGSDPQAARLAAAGGA